MNLYKEIHCGSQSNLEFLDTKMSNFKIKKREHLQNGQVIIVLFLKGSLLIQSISKVQSLSENVHIKNYLMITSILRKGSLAEY